MNIVTCYRAAKLAQVSKQYIQNCKNVNATDKSKYKFFSFDRDTGEFGVDIDHPEWKKYIKRRESMGKIKNEVVNNTESKLNSNGIVNPVDKDKFANAVVAATKIKFTKDMKVIREFVDIIEREYEKTI